MPDVLVTWGVNAEDVVIRRALTGSSGSYVEVGAAAPREGSSTYALYAEGWSGLVLLPSAELLGRHRELRPRDLQVVEERGGPVHERVRQELGDRDVELLVLTAPTSQQVHEVGSEWRPQVVLARVAGPDAPGVDTEAPTWEPWLLEHGYALALFDGMHRFYVADEHAPRLRAPLSYPACALDGPRQAGAAPASRPAPDDDPQVARLYEELLQWRGRVFDQWTTAVSLARERGGAGPQEPASSAVAGAVRAALARAEEAEAELARTRATVSWRVTAPLRQVRGRSAPSSR